MNRNKILVISCAIVVLLLASFYVGTLYSPYSLVGTGPTPAIVSKEQVIWSRSLDAGVMPPSQERLIIYNAHISVETDDITDRLAKIRALADRYGGYVASSSRSSYGMQSRAEIAIRVPKDKFHAAVQEIETYGKVLDEGTTSEDITQQFVDLKARLGNLQRQEERFREILAVAKTVEEILKVESELARVRGEIESLQGQINYLEGNVAMSLISVMLTEPAPPFTPPGMNWGEVLETAIVGLFTVARGMIIIVISMLPLAVVGAPVYYAYKRRRRQKQ